MVSLGFVFAAMAEFAFVYFIKQTQEWQSIQENIEHGGAQSIEIRNRRVSSLSKAFSDGNQATVKDGNSEEPKDQEKSQFSFWSKKCAIFYGLPFTTKLDLVGFILFHVTYMIYNFLYWFRKWDLVNKK